MHALLLRFLSQRWPWTSTRAIVSLVAALGVLAAPFSSSAAGPRTAVVFVGGLASTYASSSANFARLLGRVGAAGHGSVSGQFLFQYGGAPAAYTAERTCQPLEQSSAELANFVRTLRDRADGVILVGHSNGGVIALDVPSVAPDLVPFIRRIVTLDSPLGGLDVGQAEAFGARYGPCAAADELYTRRSTPGWQDYLAQLVDWERSGGTDVVAVYNPEDWLVWVDEQQLPADVNVALDAKGPNMNHSAVLYDAAALGQLAAIVVAP